MFQTQAVPAAVLSRGARAPDRDRRRVDRPGRSATRGSGPDTKALATALFAEYTLPFEVVSVLLLSAVVGGVFLAKRERGDGD